MTEMNIQQSQAVCTGDGSGAVAPIFNKVSSGSVSVLGLGNPYAISEPVAWKTDALNSPYAYLVQSSQGKFSIADITTQIVAPSSATFAENGTIPSGNNGKVTRPTPVRDPERASEPNIAVAFYTTFGAPHTFLTNGTAHLRVQAIDTTKLNKETSSKANVPVDAIWTRDLVSCSGNNGSEGSQCALEFSVSDAVGVVNGTTPANVRSVLIATTFTATTNGTDPATGSRVRVTRGSAIGLDPWTGDVAWQVEGNSLVEPENLKSNSSVILSAFTVPTYARPQQQIAGGDALDNGHAVPLCASVGRSGIASKGEVAVVSRVVCLSHVDGSVVAQSPWAPRTASQVPQGAEYSCDMFPFVIAS